MYRSGSSAPPSLRLHLNQQVSVELLPRQGPDDGALRPRFLRHEPSDHLREFLILAKAVLDGSNVIIELAEPVRVDVHRAIQQAGEIVM
ncbi:MAG TPA: hypothetical protein VFQ44_28855 [Streptosporangiaceae bacterium]|nr:hypothetical protein [Streptosporangiaceae bacterium]